MLGRLYCSRKKIWTLTNIRESVFSLTEIRYILQKERCQVRQRKSFKVFQLLLCGFLLLFYFIIWVSISRKISSQETTRISPLLFLLLNKNHLALLPRSINEIYRLRLAICKFLLPGRERRKAGGRPRTGFKDLVQDSHFMLILSLYARHKTR